MRNSIHSPFRSRALRNLRDGQQATMPRTATPPAFALLWLLLLALLLALVLCWALLAAALPSDTILLAPAHRAAL